MCVSFAIMTYRRRMKEFFSKAKKSPWLYTVVVITFMAVLVGCVFAVSENINDLYGYHVSYSDGVADLSDYDLDTGFDIVSMDWEWEFYYNKWLVTDGIECEPDAIMKTNKRWTGMTVGGVKLPRTGYCSYRTVVKNPPEGRIIRAQNGYSAVSYNVFVNGEKVVHTDGKVSKEPGEAYTKSTYSEDVVMITEENEEYEIIVELSYNDFGGAVMPFFLWLKPPERLETYSDMTQKLMTALALIAAIIGVFCIVFAIASKALKRFLSLNVVIIAIVVRTLASYDFICLLGYHYLSPFRDILTNDYAPMINYIIAIAVFSLFSSHTYLDGAIKPTKKQLLVFTGINVPLTLAIVFTHGTEAQIYFLLLQSLCYFYPMYMLFSGILNNKRKDSISYILLAVLFLGVEILHILAYCGKLHFHITGITTYICSGMLAVCIMVFFFQIYSDSKKALRTKELENKLMTITAAALKAQIHPHFIFNALQSIQSLYKENPKLGESYLIRFSAYLRANIEVADEKIVSFDKELENISNYFELEKIRYGERLNLLFDIDDDFTARVPILSIQPLVENAIKYAETQKLEDGYIQICGSYSDDGKYAVISVADNGKGFDPNNVREGAGGIKNVRDRFFYGMNATLDIISEPQKGTVVKIKIPLKEPIRKYA